MRVQVSTQAWGTLLKTIDADKRLVPRPNAAVTINTTVFAGATGSTTVTAFQSNDLGVLPGWVEPGSYTLVDGATAYGVEAVSGSQGGGLDFLYIGIEQTWTPANSTPLIIDFTTAIVQSTADLGIALQADGVHFNRDITLQYAAAFRMLRTDAVAIGSTADINGGWSISGNGDADPTFLEGILGGDQTRVIAAGAVNILYGGIVMIPGGASNTFFAEAVAINPALYGVQMTASVTIAFTRIQSRVPALITTSP